MKKKLFPIGKPLRLLHGKHNYTFECNLPPDLPTSIEGIVNLISTFQVVFFINIFPFLGDSGHIRYVVRIVLELKSWPHQIKFEEPFTVLQPRDLNLFPSLRVMYFYFLYSFYYILVHRNHCELNILLYIPNNYP